MEADGVVYVEVTDPRRGQSFRFYDFEHTVAMAMDGRPLPEVARDLRERAELDLSPEQLSAFAEQLQALGFLDDAPDAPASAPAPAQPGPLDDFAASLDDPDPAPLRPTNAASSPANEEDSHGVPGFFPPLAADESGHFSGATIGMAALSMNQPPAGAGAVDSSLPASPIKPARAEDPAAMEVTPPPVTLAPAAVRIAERPVAPGIDRTLTSFPPELLPNAKAKAAPKPETAAQTKAETKPDAKPAAGPGPSVPPADLTPAPLTARERTRVPLAELGARERTPPPVPMDARVSVPAQKPARPDTDDALTTEMDVVSFMADGSPAPAPADRDGSDDPMGGEITSAGMDLSQFHVDEMEADAGRDRAGTGMAAAPAPDPLGLATTGPVTVPTAKPTTGGAAEAAAAPAKTPSPEAPVPVHVPEPSAPMPADFAHVVNGVDAAAKPERDPAAGAPLAAQTDTPSGKHDVDPRERPTQELQAVQLSVRFAEPQSGDNPNAEDRRPPDVDGDGDAEAPAPPRLITPFATSDGRPAEESPRAPTPWKTYAIYAALALAAAAVITVMGLRLLETTEPNRVTVSTLTANPRTVFRYWDASAKVVLGTANALSFNSDGKVAELAAVGTKFAPGDVLGLLDSGRKFRAESTHNNDRLTHYQALLEKMTAAGNRAEMRQAELKVAEKKRLMAEAQANMAKHAILATETGEVAEVLVNVGEPVKAGAPILRGKGGNFRAVFELPREQAEKARQLGFCRAEIDGKQIECSLSNEAGDETHVPIDLPADPAVAEGKTVRLARDRLEAVFTIPASAVVRGEGDTYRIFAAVGPDGSERAEMRLAAVADRSGDEVIITQGIEVGDKIVVNPPAGLESNARLLIANSR
ncbi:MAG TPA: hypothetical protein VGG33_10275 [Polyangia bacterium]